MTVDPNMLSVYDEATIAWKLLPGAYTLFAGASSRELPLQKVIQLP